jgi:hypothetical protein
MESKSVESSIRAYCFALCLALVLATIYVYKNWLKSNNTNENFRLFEQPTQHVKLDDPFGPIGRPIHAIMKKGNCNGKVDYYSYQMPSMHGQYGCTQIPCHENLKHELATMNKSNYYDKLVCWSCCGYH